MISKKKPRAPIPRLKVTNMKLLSVYYRVAKDEPNNDKSSLQGNIGYGFSAKKKNSFIVRSTQEIKLRNIVFRARHVAMFSSEKPIATGLFDDEIFQHTAVNLLLPFGSELFANLTGKSFTVPRISPSKLTEKED